MKHPKTASSMSQAAAVLDVDVDLIREAKRAGCPAFHGSGRVDLAGLRAWLRRRSRPTKASVMAPVTPTTRGMAASLRRLEQEEAEAFTRLHGLLGRPGEAGARKAWLMVAEGLRRADLALEAARRDAGETMPRYQVEEVLRVLGWGVSVAGGALGVAVGRLVDAGRPELMAAVVEAHRNAVLSASAVAVGAITVPGWAVAALRSGAGTGLSQTEAAFGDRADLIRALLADSTEAGFDDALAKLTARRRSREGGT